MRSNSSEKAGLTQRAKRTAGSVPSLFRGLTSVSDFPGRPSVSVWVRPILFACLIFSICLSSSAWATPDTVRLDKDVFVDKCKGAWAGQMFAVCYGFPYEFRSNGKPIEGPLRAWKPEAIRGALGQDDCYVEMTFLKAMEEHGIDITPAQAGKAFAESEYDLWHANLAGRENVRAGLMPPLSGHPVYNRHADDIDFQIEADLFGIIAPGLSHESNRLCDIFGHIMNYGDGVYGGMFVAGMYAAAYFESEDVAAVMDAGLACIPKESLYHQCISDVIQWHRESPEDWLATWYKIEEKWQDDVDCAPGNPFNIDAKLNGAYIAMGLLYGQGDMMRTTQVSTRCGQDTDCNPSNAAGVLGCMKGYTALEPPFRSGIPAMEDEKFVYTDYSFKTLIPACQAIAEKLIRRAGGSVDGDAYTIPIQKPAPPVTLEQWVHQKELLLTVITNREVYLWNPDWRVVACGPDMQPGMRSRWYGRERVLALHPVSETEPAVIEADLAIPKNAKRLVINVASDKKGDFLLKVALDGNVASEKTIDTKGDWTRVEADVRGYRGKTIPVRIENCANGWMCEAAYLDAVGVE
jgi:ADP-ribosylglycohydrolase